MQTTNPTTTAADSSGMPSLAPQVNSAEALQIVGSPMDLVEALSYMREREVTEFLITCAQAVNEAAKRNDLEAVHALVHAEAQALMELNCRCDYFGWAGERDRKAMEGQLA